MLISLLLYLVAFASASAYREISSAQEIISKPYSLLYFYAYDCKFCNAFEPDFEYIASLYSGNDNLQIVKVDGRKQKHLSSQFEIRSFPSLRLYDTVHKKVVSFNGERLVSALQDFIEDYSDAVPDTDKIEMSIGIVESSTELETSGEPILVAFASKISDDWKRYYYPNHFYQRLARQFPLIKFKIVFYEHDLASLMLKYHVSNIPSLAYIEGDYLKVYNTFSTNQMVNNLISEDIMTEFVENVRIKEEGKSFSSLAELETHVMDLEYDGHKQWRGGMNLVQNANEEDVSLDQEYARLVEHICL